MPLGRVVSVYVLMPGILARNIDNLFYFTLPPLKGVNNVVLFFRQSFADCLLADA